MKTLFFSAMACIAFAGSAFASNEVVSKQDFLLIEMNEFVPIKRDLKKYVGAVSKEDSDLISKVVEEGRKVDINEW